MEYVFLKYWSIGFVVGCCFSRLTDLFVSPIFACLSFLLTLLGICRSSDFFTKIFFLLFGGFLWAVSHNAPLAQESYSPVVPYSFDYLPKSRYTVVRFQEHSYLSKGGADRGFQRGEIRYRKDSSRYLYDKIGFLQGTADRVARRSSWEQSVINAREWVVRRCYSFGDIYGWLLCVLLGETRNLDMNIFNAFQESGIFHLLVISGMHIGLLCFAFLSLTLLPLKFLYLFCFIKVQTYLCSRFLFLFLACLFLLFYGSMLGFPTAVQRSLIVFILFVLQRYRWGPQTLISNIVNTFLIQMFLFPSGFLCVSNLLTWVNFIYCLHSISSTILYANYLSLCNV